MLAAVYSQKVNPRRSTQDLAGFSRRSNDNIQFGNDDFFVKIVWLEENNKPMIIISLDTLYFPKTIADAINLYCVDKFALPKTSIIYNATHTHSAPNLAIPFFGKIDTEYVDDIEKEIIKGIEHCSSHKKVAKCTVNSFPAGKDIIGRRRFGLDIRSFFLKKRMLLLPNDTQVIDDEIRTLQIRGADDKNIALLVNFSCHPVFANNVNFSSDFPGKITKDLQDLGFGNVFFLQGFCGDIRPNYTTENVPISNIKLFMKLLFNKKVFRPTTLNDFNAFCESMVERIANNRQTKELQIPPSQITTNFLQHNLESQSGNCIKSIYVKVISINKVIFVSIPAEVNSKYIIQLKKNFPDYTIFPLGFAENVIGYLPYYTEITEGGYEVESAVNYGWDCSINVESINSFFQKLLLTIKQNIELQKLYDKVTK